jgi:hypothetical protein
VQPYQGGEEGNVAEPLLRADDTLACPLFPGITAELARLLL